MRNKTDGERDTLTRQIHELESTKTINPIIMARNKKKLAALKKKLAALDKRKRKKHSLYLCISGFAIVVLLIVFCILKNDTTPESMNADMDTSEIESSQVDEAIPSEHEYEDSGIEPEHEKLIPAEKIYCIGDLICLNGKNFFIYKIGEDSVYLLSEHNIAEEKREDVDSCISTFVRDLTNNGIVIESYGSIDKDDLYDLGFVHNDSLSGLPYYDTETPEFVKSEDSYWVDGYCKYNTYSWAYAYGQLDSYQREELFGVRPAIVMLKSELGYFSQE